MKRIAITQRLFWLQYFIVALSSCVLPSLPAHAEGSLQLVHNGTGYRAGNRPYLEFLPGTLLSGIPFSTTIKVYAQAGETLNLGSSAVNLGLTGDIKVRAPGVLPNSPAEISCRTLQPGTGLINSLARELAGPFHPTQNTNPNAYTPCLINVTQTGVWEIDFVSPRSTIAASPPNTATNAVWSQPNNVPYVAAWDVTVRNSSGVAIPGRAFTNSLALITGANPRPIHSELFVQTTDGYRYRVDLNGLDPNGFVFFANNKGFLEASTRNPLYRSVNLSATFGLPPDVTLHLPTTANNPATGDFTHQIFFNPPDTAVLIPTLDTGDINNFRFEGSEGNTLGQAGTSPLGGAFKFTPPSTGTAVLNIDANGNNIFNELEDVQLTQYVGEGIEAQIFWDGRDGEGNVVPPRNIPYRVQLTFPFGEVHFPLIDPENDSNGIIIERLNPTSDFTLYFNDDTMTIAPGPINAGQNNSSSAPRPHSFSNSSGDLKGIDRWTFFTPPPLELTGGILIAAADLKITKTRTPDPAIVGGNITYTITVTNAGPSNITTASPATVSDIFTANGDTVINLNWTCAITTTDAGGTCMDETGTGNLSNARLALDAGASAQYTLTGTIIPTATQNIVNDAVVTRPNDVADPVNDDTDQNNNNNRTETATVTVPLTPGNPLLGVAKQLNTVVNNGDGTYDATYTIRVENLGNLDILNLQVTEDLYGTAESTFASAVAAPQIVTAPQIVAGTLTEVNPNFNGNGNTGDPTKDLLAETQTLPVRESINITFTVRVTPGSQLGPYENTATATGTSPGGTVVSDDSTDDENLDPLAGGDGDPRDTNTPTTVTFGEMPLIGVAKAAGTPIDNGDRTFTIPYTLIVRNYGDVPLNTLQVTENLNETFPNLTYTVVPGSLTSSLTVNSQFDGKTNTTLLAAGNTLAVDARATINFAVRVTPGNNLGPFNNQVTASGVTPGGTGVSDLSTNGSNPRGNNDTGGPTQSNEITPVTLSGNPNLELEKRITRVNGTVVGQSENLVDWPANFVRGLSGSNTIQPGDEVEYTIYFLSAGSGPLENAVVCDPLQNYQTFQTNTFNGQTPTEGDFGAEVGIAFALNPPNPDLPTAYLRSANSASNRGRFYPSGTPAPSVFCSEPNVRGAVVVDIGNLGVGEYGFIRFRVKID
ncbi:DUF11 domain-containing protein [Laspinema sp. A4]|uniref:DUF11 domain-containing protein n=1 Tax=Laspinema sp. D2d TaxID=2953686 RepID=UPI0021BA970B|nr:DUF11 domain-containing protein [Laspinema sp. D2d]MCT7984461.1 DUF11 domain-containing protein [Laspinema sp. D2d]